MSLDMRNYIMALMRSIKEHGEEHPDMATSYNSMAASLQAQGEYQEAQPLFEKAVRMAITTLGDHHPYTKAFKRNRDANHNRLDN